MSYKKHEFKSREKLYASQLNEMDEQIYKNTTEKIDHPTTGAVGQILEIESVDENGKPKTYKAVDKPQTNPSTNITSENIKNALGYTPAKEETVSELSGQISDIQESIGEAETLLSTI